MGVCTVSLRFQEIGVADGWESSSLVNDRSVVNLLVDGDSVVDSCRLNGFTLDDRLNSLVDVVVFVFVNVCSEMST